MTDGGSCRADTGWSRTDGAGFVRDGSGWAADGVWEFPDAAGGSGLATATYGFGYETAYGVFRAFGVESAGIREDRQQTGGNDQPPLGFRDFGSPAFKTLNSFGVWAKNSARDITGKDARALAELILSAIFR